MESNRNQESLIAIGRIVKSFGIRGEVAVEILTDFPHRFIEMKKILLVNERTEAPPREVAIESARFHKNQALLKFDFISTPEEGALYRGWLLKIPKEEVMELEQDEYYVFELIGLEVFDTAGTLIGKIINVIPAGAHDVYEMKHPETGKVNMVPACKQFIRDVNLQAGKMIIDPIEGLIEL
ncbi:MAG: ribosome maturation factor RimM [Firmicutes bacterium]|nr:ribosome maturation factor RimM [Bacillota bacterium]